jgi:exonuclease III
MRILTWNCCQRAFAGTAGFARELRPDVAVLQECGRPDGEESSRVRWIGENPRKGIAVLAGDGYAVEPVAAREDVPRWIVPFRVTGPRELTLVAGWALPTGSSYARTVLRGIAAYADLIASGPAVVAGDFNTNSALDRGRRDWTHARVVDALAELGLASAYHHFRGEAHGAETAPTYFHLRRREQPFHIDYCFVPRAWADRLAGVRVGTFDEWAGRSDHRPLVVDLDLELC